MPAQKAEAIKFSRDPREHFFRGFVFVTMQTHEDANKAIEELRGQTFHGKAFHVNLAKRNRSRTPTPGQFMGLKKGQYFSFQSIKCNSTCFFAFRSVWRQ